MAKICELFINHFYIIGLNEENNMLILIKLNVLLNKIKMYRIPHVDHEKGR